MTRRAVQIMGPHGVAEPLVWALLPHRQPAQAEVDGRLGSVVADPLELPQGLVQQRRGLAVAA